MTTKEREKLEAVQRVLENASMGGVGPDGPDLLALRRCVELTGQPMEDNADYHTMQAAWMMIQDLLT